MTPVVYDTHCHLDYPDFDADRDAVVARAVAAGVTKLIVIGTDLASSGKAVALARQHAAVYAVVGWHPGHATEAPADIRRELRELARQPKVVGLGETGLDYYRLPEGEAAAAQRAIIRKRQADLFKQHLEVAAELGLNCVIHQRGDAFEDTVQLMRTHGAGVRAVFHCFTNGPEDLARVLTLNGLVSFTGIVTFKNADLVRASVAAVPADRYMVETDAPFLAPVPFRGKRCESVQVRHTADELARVRGITLETLGRETCATAESFFRGLGAEH